MVVCKYLQVARREKKNEMYAVFLLRAGFRLIGGKNREADFYFYFYSKSIFLII